MAEITKPIKIGNYWTNLVDSVTGESVNFEGVTTWWDGTPMDDSKADGEVYRKLPTSVGGGYVRRVYDNFGQLFLEKDTMAEMRSLSSTEILLIQIGRYKGVKLNGYYDKGDTPNPIEYLLSETLESDDGGSVIEVGGVKLQHEFVGSVDITFFGANTSLLDNATFINNLLIYSSIYKNVVTVPEGEFFIQSPLIGINGHPLQMIGAGINKSKISAGSNLDFVFNLNLTTNTSYIHIKGIDFDGKNITETTLSLDNCHHFVLEDVRVLRGVVGLIIKNSWCYDLNGVSAIFNVTGCIIGGVGPSGGVNNNGTIRSCKFYLNQEVGIILLEVSDMKFSNTVIETNKKLGMYIGAASRGISFDSMYIEFNGDEGVDVEYQSGTETKYNQIIIGGGSWRNNGNIVPNESFIPYTISFNNMMIVQTQGGINKDTINVLNGNGIYVNSCWSAGNINLIFFKDSQTTSLNNLVTNNNYNIGGGSIIELDYEDTRTSSRSNVKTWIINEELRVINDDISVANYSRRAQALTVTGSGNYLGWSVFNLDIPTSGTLSFYRTITPEIVNEAQLYYSVLYKSTGTFSIVLQESGVSKIKNFPASPDSFSEATVCLPESINSNLIISIGIYSGTGSVLVCKPEIGVVGNPRIKPDYIKRVSSRPDVISGTNNTDVVTPFLLQAKLDDTLPQGALTSPTSGQAVDNTDIVAKYNALQTRFEELVTKLNQVITK